MSETTLDEDIMAKLQEPFPPEDIEWRVGATNKEKTKGVALAYITNRALQTRLDDLFGPFGWRNDFREWKGKSQLCGISIKCGDEWITKWDGADDSDYEPTKGGLSDAMKRAGYQWGIGRYLYALENVWYPIKQAGKFHVLVSEPRLPNWALPKGYSPKKQTEKPPAAPEPEVTITEEPKTPVQPDMAAHKQELLIQYKMGNGGKATGFDAWFQKCHDKGYTFPHMKHLLDSAAETKKVKTTTPEDKLKTALGF